MTLTAAHREMLIASAITPDVIDASGIRSTSTGIDFPWSDRPGLGMWQSRPDKPFLNEDGKPVKYVFPKGAKVPFNRLRDGEQYGRVLIAEGTKQQYAVLSHAPADFAVYGMSGCWGYKHADMSVADGRDVFLLLDADVDTNPDVYAAADAMTKQLKLNGAKSVRYVATTGTGKEGVDDVLAALPEERRAHMLRTWLSAAPAKLGKRPKAKRPEATDAETEAIKLFKVRPQPLNFQPLDGAQMVLDTHPAAVTREGTIALYRGGVYSVDADAVMCVLALKLGNMYAPSYVKSTEHLLTALLLAEGKTLPERVAEPLLNCPNGMVDLRTGELGKHDPAYLSHVQVSVPCEAGTATPVYDAWLRQALRQEDATDADVEALVADLEETAGTMLDPTRTPSKALFLFGASRSGKSTFLRLLKAVAGAANTSAVTLHDLGTDTFATANLYGRMLNVAADLSNKHVEDLSKFKMATGEDPLQANRKYGKQFEFTNQALFAFSANDLPTVSEASRAYAERMKPFEFPNSFAGREDKTLEPKLMAELPGILARWVAAYGRFLARGGYGRTDQATQTQFEAKSDRVVQFFQDMCTMTEARFGQTLADDECTGRRDASIMFNEWAERNGGSKMGERAFFQRLAQIEGVTEVKRTNRGRAYNLVIRKSDEDVWDDAAAEPVADPIPASGVTATWVDPQSGPAKWADENPWQAPVDVSSYEVAPVDAEPVNAPQTDAQGFPPVGTDAPAEPSFLSFNEDYFS